MSASASLCCNRSAEPTPCARVATCGVMLLYLVADSTLKFRDVRLTRPLLEVIKTRAVSLTNHFALICFSSFSRRAMIESKDGGSRSNIPSAIIFS